MSESTIAEIGMQSAHAETMPLPFLDIASEDGFEKLFDFQKEGAKSAEKLLATAFRIEALKDSDFKHVLDFGAGYGGPTFTLSKIAKELGGSVTAIEKGPLSTKVLQSGVIPDIHVAVDDGIAYLDSLRDTENKASLITAFMFGPDRTATFFKKFMSSSNHALTEDGKLFVNSDKETMVSITELCTSYAIPYTVVDNTTTGEATTIIIQKNDCKELP